MVKDYDDRGDAPAPDITKETEGPSEVDLLRLENAELREVIAGHKLAFTDIIETVNAYALLFALEEVAEVINDNPHGPFEEAYDNAPASGEE